MAKRTHGYERDHRITVRFNEAELRILEERRLRAGADTSVAYIRHRTIAGPESQLPPHETLRDLRNEVVKAELAKDHPALIRALDRISRL